MHIFRPAIKLPAVYLIFCVFIFYNEANKAFNNFNNGKY